MTDISQQWKKTAMESTVCGTVCLSTRNAATISYHVGTVNTGWDWNVTIMDTAYRSFIMTRHNHQREAFKLCSEAGPSRQICCSLALHLSGLISFLPWQTSRALRLFAQSDMRFWTKKYWGPFQIHLLLSLVQHAISEPHTRVEDFSSACVFLFVKNHLCSKMFLMRFVEHQPQRLLGVHRRNRWIFLGRKFMGQRQSGRLVGMWSLFNRIHRYVFTWH